jgi:hypothetical protein
MKTVDIQTLAQYEDQYIALTLERTEILAAGKTIKEVEAKLAKRNVEDAVIQYIPPTNAYLSPLCR